MVVVWIALSSLNILITVINQLHQITLQRESIGACFMKTTAEKPLF